MQIIEKIFFMLIKKNIEETNAKAQWHEEK
jgi:hypothetical protein